MDNQWISSSLQSLKSGVWLTLLSRILTFGISLLATIITARFLGPEGRGEFIFITTVGAIIAQFGNFGLHAGNTYLVAQDQKLLGGLLANSFWISLLAGGLAFFFTTFVFFFHLFPGFPVRYLWIAAALVPVMLFYMLGV
ncbi:MAG TPA: hypothetical protein VHY08_26970, partial [Bacillota bacterium]|nr:hypothetical protein [Bacillota bacterium]